MNGPPFAGRVRQRPNGEVNSTHVAKVAASISGGNDAQNKQPESRSTEVVPPVPGGSGTGTGSGSAAYRAEPQNQGGQRRDSPEPLFESMADLLRRAAAAPDSEWLIEPLVLATGSVFLVAPPNAGKTFLALVIAKTAAEQGRRVFIVEEEGGLKAFSSRIGNLGFSSIAMTCTSIAHQRGVKLDTRTLKLLSDELAKADAPVLVLDPLSALFEGDENETKEASALMRRVMALQRANPRLLLVLLHHSSKAGAKGDNGPMLYAARGSSVFSGWCDTQLNLEGAQESEGSGRVSFFIDVAKQRDEEKAPRHKMTVALGTGEVSLIKASAAARDDRARKAIAVLEDAPEGMSRNELAKAMGGNRQYALKTISQLFNDGVFSEGVKGVVLVPSKRPATADMRFPEESADA